MISNHQIIRFIFCPCLFAWNHSEPEWHINISFLPALCCFFYISSRITYHAFWYICKLYIYVFFLPWKFISLSCHGKLTYIVNPQCSITTPNLKNSHPLNNTTLLIYPRKPSLFINWKPVMKINSCRYISSINVLILHAVFHISKMDNLQHITPVNSFSLFNRVFCFFNSFTYKLHLCNLVLYHSLLKFKWIL